MNLFEKIDLFEKMANELVDGNTVDGSETFDNVNEFEPNHEVKASIRDRKDLLKYLVRG
jgi:hypothetical protein